MEKDPGEKSRYEKNELSPEEQLIRNLGGAIAGNSGHHAEKGLQKDLYKNRLQAGQMMPVIEGLLSKQPLDENKRKELAEYLLTFVQDLMKNSESKAGESQNQFYAEKSAEAVKAAEDLQKGMGMRRRISGE